MNKLNDQFIELLKSHPQKSHEALKILLEEMERKDCKFGNDIVPIFLKPIFVAKSDIDKISRILTHVISILEKICQLYFTHPELKDYFCLGPKDELLLEFDHGYNRNVIISRPDSFLVHHFLNFVEFNCDSPAGPGYCDVQEDAFHKLFPLSDMKEQYSFAKHSRSGNLLDALLLAYKEFSGTENKPNIAIVDWKEVRTKNEFHIIQRIFKSRGYETIVADPRELKFQNNQLSCDGFPIDLVYRRVIFKEMVAHLDDVQAFVKAIQKGKVCVANPLRSRLASTKAILAIMTNQKDYAGYFTPEENEIIKKYIPWTRRVVDVETDYEDQTINLKKFVIQHRDDLVLKPSDSYGGKDVSIGSETSSTDWAVLLNQIIGNHLNWVVQKRVEIPQTEVPLMNGDDMSFQTKKFNINPFIFSGKYAGSIARYSDQSVINVSAGGGMVPVIEYEEIV